MLTQEQIEKLQLLSPSEEVLLLKRLSDNHLSPKDIPLSPIKHRQKSNLSYAQEGIWFLHQLFPEANNYLLSRCLCLKGVLNGPAIEASLQIIANRHEILRSRLVVDQGMPFFVIENKNSITIEHHNLQEVSPEHHIPILNCLASKPIHLEKDPLFQLHLLALKPEENILLIVVHHIICDASSIDVILREIAESYNTLIKGFSPSFPLLSFHYTDFIDWQRRWFRHELLSDSFEYWKNLLKGAPKLSAIPFDFNAEKATQGKADYVQFKLGGADILSFAQKQKSTPFNFFLALITIVMYRFTGESDILIGTPVSNRLRPELKEIVGLFINTIVLRNVLPIDSSFYSYLQAISEHSTKAFHHQLVPFEDIVKMLKYERELLLHPIFQVLFIYQESTQDHLELEGLTWEKIPISSGFSKYPISIEITLQNNHFEVRLEYDTAFYKRETIDYVACQFQEFICQVIDYPMRPMRELFFLLESDRSILLALNSQRPTILPDISIHQLIDSIATQMPKAVALVDENGDLSYGDLFKQTEIFARALLDSGVKPGEGIGVYFEEDSMELIPCLIAIWKAGCHYIPLPIQNPLQRLLFCINQSNINFIAISSSAPVPPFSGVEVIRFTHTFSSQRLLPIVSLSSLAYTIYTSGSTGRPKGIPITHRNILNALSAFKKITEIQAKDRWLSVTTYGFDISVLEFFLPLSTGASLHLLKRKALQDPSLLITELMTYRPTIIQGTPSFWQFITSLSWKPQWSFKILCGGERMPPHLAKDLFQLSSEVFNLYGPTETTIWSTYHKLSLDDVAVFIGKPIDNTRLYILNRDLLPVPVNVQGNLYIAGEGVSKGYIKEPSLTKASFITLPGLVEKEPLFFTGDIVKVTSLGLLEYIGRSDEQIKVRGFRVEPQEIEAILLKDKRIKNVAISSRIDASKNISLIAFLEIAGNEEETLSTIREEIRHYLPEYMIPSQLITIDQIPKLPNGKIDRMTVQTIPIQSPRITVEGKSPLHQELCRIWAANLNVQDVDLDKTYFEQGGHSLLAIQLVHAIKKEMDKELTLKELYTFPRISLLAQHLNEKQLLSHPRSEIYIAPDDFYNPFELSDVQRAYIAGNTVGIEENKRENLAEPGPELQSVSSHLYREIEIKQLNFPALEQVLNHLIKRHPALRLVTIGYAQQQILESTPYYILPINDWSKEEDQIAQQNFLNRRKYLSHQNFDTELWPLFDIQVSLLPSSNYLHISIHLLIADAASLNLLLNELFYFYENPTKDLPKLQYTFRDYMWYIKTLESSSEYKKAENYWKQKLPSFPPGPDLPLVLSTQKNQFKRFSMQLDKQKWMTIKQIGLNKGFSPTIILLASYLTVLRRWSTRKNFSLVLTLFDRLPIHPDINAIVGDFTTILIFQSPHINATFFDFVQSCQEALFNDLDHRLYNGIRFTQDLLEQGTIREPIPFVFTSLLGLAENRLTFLQEKDTEAYAITQTPQVLIDHQVMENNGCLLTSWDVAEEAFPEGLIISLFETYFSFLDELSYNNSPALPIHYTYSFNEMVQARAKNVHWEAKRLFDGFMYHALHTPERIAVVQGDERITYGKLAEAASQVRAILQGKERETPVGIQMQKGWRQVASCLGTILAGYAYMPLEVDLPKKRLREILDASRSSIVLVQELQNDLPEQCVIDFTRPSVSYLEKQSEVSPNQLAYIIYTSGSTGSPKGVMIEHGSAMNTIQSIHKRFDITADDTVYAISSLSFDLSIYDIFGPLSIGAKIVFPEVMHQHDPQAWVQDIDRHQVSLWNSAPLLMDMLVTHLQEHKENLPLLRHLKTVLLSGDIISPHLVQTLHALCPSANIASLGGATEASIWSIIYPIPFNENIQMKIPYGFSLENQQVFVLDTNLEECPAWVSGEIFIGGLGVARGYLHDPAANDKYFVRHPRLGRLFRTFDQGRYRLDGVIEFEGRLDRQVKIHGHRIELREIEIKLEEHPAVKQAIVLACQATPQEKELRAFITLYVSAGDPVSVERKENYASRQHLQEQLSSEDLLKCQMRDFLIEHLPPTMIPQSFSILPSFPMTSNGKIDYALLVSMRSASKNSFPIQMDQSELLNTLQQIWKTILKTAKIPPIQVSFFAFGGNSLMLIKLHAEFERVFKIRIPIADLFKYATIEMQANYLHKKGSLKVAAAQSIFRSSLRRQLRNQT